MQEYRGLVDHIKDVADRFAAEGLYALAPDLYHGEKTKSPDEAGKLMRPSASPRPPRSSRRDRRVDRDGGRLPEKGRHRRLLHGRSTRALRRLRPHRLLLRSQASSSRVA